MRRGGDSLVGTAYRSFRSMGSVAMVALSWSAIAVAVAWAVLALFIGKENAKVAARIAAQADGE